MEWNKLQRTGSVQQVVNNAESESQRRGMTVAKHKRSIEKLLKIKLF